MPATGLLLARTAANRRLAAELLDPLTDEQWDAPSLCEGWTIRVLAGHMLMPLVVSFPRVLARVALARGDFERVTDDVSRELATRPTGEIVQLLRDRGYRRQTPPGVGPMGPFADSCIHLRDAARPLGSDLTPPLADWGLVLDFLLSDRAALGFVSKGRLAGLAFQATDQAWHGGFGEQISGPSEAVAMAISGRSAALSDLSGPGVESLRQRISGVPT